MDTLMNWWFGLAAIWQALVAGIGMYLLTAVGASAVFWVRGMPQRALDLMMGFAAGVMLSASFWSLLAPAVELSTQLGRGLVDVVIGFVAGGLLMVGSDVVLERLATSSESWRRSVLLAGAVTMHNIPEGLAVGVAFGSVALGISGATVEAATMLAVGIGIQNLPEGMCIAMPLCHGGATRARSFAVGQASGIVEPFATVLGVLWAMSIQSTLALMLALSAGAMIAVVCSELVPRAFCRHQTVATLGVLGGFAVMMVLDLALA